MHHVDYACECLKASSIVNGFNGNTTGIVWVTSILEFYEIMSLPFIR